MVDVVEIDLLVFLDELLLLFDTHGIPLDPIELLDVFILGIASPRIRGGIRV